MKVKKIKIKSRIEFESELRAIGRALDRGESPRPAVGGVFFESLDAVRSVLTDKRLELWRTIRDRKPASISALAVMVGRSFRTVHRDVKLLEMLELVKLKKTKGERGDLQHPVSLADELLLSVG